MRTVVAAGIALAFFAQVPAPVNNARLVFFDAAAGRLMLAGAYAGGARDLPALLPLWALQDGRWTPVDTEGTPPMKRLAAAAYDSRRNRFVLFGGIGNRGYEQLHGDTWEWDGSRWHDVSDTRIGTRDHHGMAFDAVRGVTVMYGGVSSDRSQPAETWVYPTETWTFDGHTWREAGTVGPNPGPRSSPAMAYDAARERIVLFGGAARGGTPLGDTWLWDGQAWMQMADAGGPGPRFGPAIATDPWSGGVVLFGGWSGQPRNVYYDDLWRWDGRQWTEVPIDGPRPDAGSQAGLAFDSANQRLVLSGGGTVSEGRFVPADGPWSWNGVRWSRVE